MLCLDARLVIGFVKFEKAGILPENIIDEQIDVWKDDNYPSNSSGDLDKRFAIVVKQM